MGEHDVKLHDATYNRTIVECMAEDGDVPLTAVHMAEMEILSIFGNAWVLPSVSTTSTVR